MTDINNDVIEILRSIEPLLGSKVFQIPNSQGPDDYFPDFLAELMGNYKVYIEDNIDDKINNLVGIDSKFQISLLEKIEQLICEIEAIVDHCCNERFSEASLILFDALDNINHSKGLKLSTEIEPNFTFYRTRKDDGNHFSKQDLFHVDFELSHIIKSKRYCLPGFPALYLGDTPNICWEELGKPYLRDLWFVKYENQKKLEVLQIQRVEDFKNEFYGKREFKDIHPLFRFLISFPLSLACSVIVKNDAEQFKPEHIIPQLLSEYVFSRNAIDGIKFPSTNINYKKLGYNSEYNYYFPVKSDLKSGYCSELANIFYLTDPIITKNIRNPLPKDLNELAIRLKKTPVMPLENR